MSRKAIGPWARMNVEAIKRGEALQALALQALEDAYRTESDDLTLDNLTWENFSRKLDKSMSDGTMDEFEAQIAALLMPIVEQVMNAGGTPDGGA